MEVKNIILLANNLSNYSTKRYSLASFQLTNTLSGDGYIAVPSYCNAVKFYDCAQGIVQTRYDQNGIH